MWFETFVSYVLFTWAGSLNLMCEAFQEPLCMACDCVCVCVCVCVSRSVVLDSLRPYDCGPPGFSVHGILQAKILAWVASSFSMPCD